MMTASLLPFSAVDRLSRRTAGALLAVAVQALFIMALLLWAVPPLSIPRGEREIIFHLVPAVRPQPPVRIIGAPVVSTHKPAASAAAPSSAPPSVAAPPSGIAGFGQSLFGCAPENYASLSPDQRARCTKPGEGLAYNAAPDLMGGRAHAKDNARWANAMAHKQTLPMLPGGMLFPLVALGAIVDGSITEPHSAFRDPEQWPAERDPNQFMPHSLDEQERVYDAWNRQHPKPAAECAPEPPPGAHKAAASCPAPP